MTALRIGTRRSPLAVAQAELVARLLGGLGSVTEVIPMSTSGDEEAAPTSGLPGGLKGLWTDTILDALESGEIDVAVHSAKDLPADEEDGFVIGAVPERADPRDVLVMRDGQMKPNATIGTSSIRRSAQLLAAFPGMRVTPIRGNVETRLRKLAEGEVDALMLAAAGLERLGLEPEHARPLDVNEMVPAPGQGCLAIQCRDDDADTIAVLGEIDHEPSNRALMAERSLMWRLGGGCALPLGGFAIAGRDGVTLQALIASPDGGRVIRTEATAPTAEDVAASVAKTLIAEGAEQILAEVLPESSTG